ncbi:MAG: hypothetical protein AB1782_18475 [Cyanobacteriota bacterium]
MVNVNPLNIQPVSFSGKNKKSNTTGKLIGAGTGYVATRAFNSKVLPAQIGRLFPEYKNYLEVSKQLKNVPFFKSIINRKSLSFVDEVKLECVSNAWTKLPGRVKAITMLAPVVTAAVLMTLGASLGGRAQEKLSSRNQ